MSRVTAAGSSPGGSLFTPTTRDRRGATVVGGDGRDDSVVGTFLGDAGATFLRTAADRPAPVPTRASAVSPKANATLLPIGEDRLREGRLKVGEFFIG